MATVNDIITEVDSIRPSQYDDQLKVEWLSNLDMKIMNHIIKTHVMPLDEIEDEDEFNGYTEADMDKELLVKEPYSELYKFYLFAMIDFYNGESTRYVNSMAMFNNSYEEFENYYNRHHMPLSANLDIWG